MLDDHLAPGIDVVLVRPAGVEGLDVELEIGAAELQKMKHEQGQIGMGEGGVVGHRAGPGHPRVELAEIELAALLVDQEIELEIPRYPSFRSCSPKRKVRSRASRRMRAVKESAKISLPHQPPL
jgi:hypothetical protein